MSGGIFILHEDGKLDEMREQPYDSENLLQALLAKYPNLLAGDQIDSDEPRRWLLISQEMGIPDQEGGGERWSLDHLFLDQDAIPTLVEVKRSSDTRIRREVVGQMLDYAANSVLYWPVETIHARFEQTCKKHAVDPVAELAHFLGGSDTESFWQQVKTNLQAGRVRLVFVADDVPQELRRVVEFLNGQMDPAEVLAIEVKQYVGDSKMKTLVPRLVGQTAAAQQRKAGVSPKQEKIDEQTYLMDILQRRGSEDCSVVRRIIEWAVEQKLDANFNKWEKITSFIPTVKTDGGPRYPLSVQSGGDIWVQMRWLRESTPFDDEGKRRELCMRLNEIPGVKIPLERMTGYPRIPLQALRNDTALNAFLDTITWIVAELRAQAKFEPR
jgi:hypothetical protein